jgi:GAF domain-containing protein
LIGRAALTNAPILVPNTAENAEWLPNDLLPETKSEIAVPITLGDQVLGVIDVQHNLVNGLHPADVVLLQNVANQVAIALQNARAYEDAQHQADREALINTIAQKIQTTTTLDELLQVATRELGQALSTPHTRAHINLEHLNS